MRPGFWQIVFLVALLALFFHRQIFALFRLLTGGSREKPRQPFRGASKCSRCGASMPSGARFCPRCGSGQEFIDV